VLYEPLGEHRSAGWVICHSFGQEHSHLMEHEVVAARALASAGFPTLRYHGQGYGDSMGHPGEATLESHVGDALGAVDVLLGRTGIHDVGVLGARFGGAVAAIV